MRSFRISLLLITLLLFSNFLFSQKDTVHKITFSSASSWEAEVKDYSYSYFEDNRLIITNKSNKKKDIFIKKFNYDYNLEFCIETSLSYRSGSVYAEFGLVWGAEDRENFYCLAISASGIVRIFNTIKGVEKNILDPILLDIISPNSDNIISIEYKEGEIHYYINKLEIYAHPPVKIYGTGVGFMVSPESSISVDYIEFRYKSKGISIANDIPESLTKINLGKEINTKYNELMPIISYDGNTLYFSRIGHPNNYGIEKKEDVWISEKDINGKWSEARNFGKPFNNEENNSVISISPSGNMLVLANTYKKDGSPGREEGISVSFKDDKGKWLVPAPVFIENFKNTNKFKNFFLCSDRKTLLMAIENEHSKGGLDLFVSFLKYDEDSILYWTEPINMGNDVNTYADDFSPFLAADGKTLYFASKGLPGFGDADIYKSIRLDSTWKKWSKPLNLGAAVNSKEFDAYFYLPASGDIAYFVSEDQAIGGTDIFYISLVQELQPEPVVMVKGKVLNKKNDEPLGANISYFNQFSEKEAGFSSSDPLTGNYAIVLPAGYTYSFFAKKDGFYPLSDSVDLTEIKSYAVFEKNLYLFPIEVGKAIRLNNIFFDYDKAELLPNSYAELNRLVKLLNDFPSMIIEISGHTDSDGSEEYNQKLSEARAKAVVDYLIMKGIDMNRLSYKGYGETLPIASNATKEGKALNRRVEFVILKK